ncbi:small subunit ribosomal protein S8 [Rhizobium sp. SG_E_25_P2]|jgi:small subunit ribosomal protein S8|uniref:30S ribosomal protein S8 n=1 Tax=Rhizobium sp. SG_E_25_P2 TaxID=2879942 RepID=UPI0024752724|nr:30S ribosomal protein S8 [Rhizobium sp. SG_E_25_P2]MDH6269836.1 small subunit ribosomal protein S8 [Rhizobium sp. SG_E_25_P2]
MSMSDPLGDMLTRIRNGVARRKSSVSTPASNLRARVLDVMQAEGYIRGYSKTDFENGKSELNIELKYYEGAPVIRKIDRVSKPGRRVYVSVKSIPQVANGLGITILSTPKGVMADHQAREQNVGGELLCSIF